jgi:hypothetical protein
MTEAQYKEAHIALWDWLCNFPMRYEEDWPMWKKNGGPYDEVYEYNFACEYSSQKNGALNCTACPLEIQFCPLSKSPWNIWYQSHSIKTRKKYAAIVRDSWREGGKNKRTTQQRQRWLCYSKLIKMINNRYE